jgi:hypothetical protein
MGFFLREVYGMSYCVCDIGNVHENSKETFYKTAHIEIVPSLHGKNQTIDRSL